MHSNGANIVRSKIRLAILECDTPLPQTKKNYGGYGGVFQTMLCAGAQSEGYSDPSTLLQIEMHHIENDPEDYPDPETLDAVLVTGSRHDSFSDAPWIMKLVDYTTQLLKEGKVRVIGVCFGHQIVCRALGAKVGRNPAGWEAAVNDVELSAKGKELFQLPVLRVHQMHRDIAFTYPTSSSGHAITALGSSPVCKVQGMYVPRHLITTQGHPEFTEPIMREIVEARHATGIFNEEAYLEHIKKVELPHDGIAVSRAFIRFLTED